MYYLNPVTSPRRGGAGNGNFLPNKIHTELPAEIPIWDGTVNCSFLTYTWDEEFWFGIPIILGFSASEISEALLNEVLQAPSISSGGFGGVSYDMWRVVQDSFNLLFY